MLFKVLSQMSDSSSEQSNLHLCRTRIFLPTTMGTYEFLLAVLSQRHLRYSPSVGDQ
jgi:hypothetical protein